MEKNRHQKSDAWEKGGSVKLLQFGMRRIVAIANALITAVDGGNPSFVSRVACVSTC